MKVTLLILKFLFIGALFIVSNNNLYLSDTSDFETFKGMYSNWLNSLFDSVKEISGYVIKSDWLPENFNNS